MKCAYPTLAALLLTVSPVAAPAQVAEPCTVQVQTIGEEVTNLPELDMSAAMPHLFPQPTITPALPAAATAASGSLSLQGDGSADNPYLIATAAQWNELAAYMDSDSATLTGKYVKISDDIDFSATGITPMGCFDGDLDGNGKTLKGITDSLTADYSAPVITTATSGASIHDLTVEGTVGSTGSYTGAVIGVLYGTASNITSNVSLNSGNTADDSGNGTYCVAGIVGYAGSGATVTGCAYGGTYNASCYYASGIVGYANGATVSECVNNGSISSSSHYAAGIIGYATDCSITRCSNKGTVASSYVYAAGIAGYATGCSITGCSNDGAVTGSLYYYGGVVCWLHDSKITDCVNNGALTQEYSSSGYSGGVVAVADTLSTISGCVNRGTVTCAGPNCGGVIGFCQYAVPTGCTNEGTVTLAEKYSGGVIGYIRLTSASQCVNNGSVNATAQYSGGVVGGTYSSVISQCTNASTATVATSGDFSAGVVGYAYKATLTDCVNNGTIEGAGKYTGGVLGYAFVCESSGCINKGTVNVENGYSGGVVGQVNYGSMSACLNEGAISATGQCSAGLAGLSGWELVFENCANTGSVTYAGTSSASYTGGLIGYAYPATLDSCYNSGTVKATNSGSGYLGGLIAYCYGTSLTDLFYITNCYNSSDISSAYNNAGLICYGNTATAMNMTNCYNSGKITADSTSALSANTAGVSIYYYPNSTFRNCYNTGDISSSAGRYTGGVFAYYRGTTSTFTASYPATITGCYNTANVTSAGGRTAGILAYMYRYVTIDSCWNTGDISGDQYVAGIVGYMYGNKTAAIYNSFNAGNISCPTSYAAGIVAYNAYEEEVGNCFNTGNVTATNGYAGGIAAYGASNYTNVYNTGTITGDSIVGGIIARPYAGRTDIVNGYSAGKIVASGTCGNILGVGTDRTTYWTSSNSMSSTYYLSSNAVECVDTTSKAVDYADLAKLDLGSDWTAGDNYTYPRITSIADNDYAKASAVAVIPAGSDTYSSITGSFGVGAIDGVSWTASPEVITVEGNTATFSESYTGTLTMTATCGEATAITTLTCDVTTVGTSSPKADAARTLESEEFYTPAGIKASPPSNGQKSLYIVKRLYTDGSTETAKELR